MKKTNILLPLISLLLLGPGVSAEQLLEVGLKEGVPFGQKPVLKIHVLADLNSLELELKRTDGRKVHHRWTDLAEQTHLEFELPQTQGRFRYQGHLKASAHDKSAGEMKLDFQAGVQAKPKSMGLVVRDQDLNLEQHHLLLRASRPIAKIDYTVTSEDGHQLAQGSYSNPEPARQVKLSWQPEQTGKVMKIDLQAHDQDGRWEKIQLIPWSWEIPHEEVLFATARWEITEAETPKLDKSYQLLEEGQARYQDLIQAKLYIGGFTDAVGSARSNQKLSENRARAIARYFRDKGFAGQIFYQGFGEKGQRVQTADNIPEAKNRRAVYVLAGTAPRLSHQGSTGWLRLSQ